MSEMNAFEALVADALTAAADEYESRLRDGDSKRKARESAEEQLHETIDQHGTVIYTQCAKEALMLAPEPFAYFDEYGSDGFDKSKGWEVLLYAAAMREANNGLNEQLEAVDEKLEAEEEAKEAAEVEAEAAAEA